MIAADFFCGTSFGAIIGMISLFIGVGAGIGPWFGWADPRPHRQLPICFLDRAVSGVSLRLLDLDGKTREVWPEIGLLKAQLPCPREPCHPLG